MESAVMNGIALTSVDCVTSRHNLMNTHVCAVVRIVPAVCSTFLRNLTGKVYSLSPGDA